MSLINTLRSMIKREFIVDPVNNSVTLDQLNQDGSIRQSLRVMSVPDNCLIVKSDFADNPNPTAHNLNHFSAILEANSEDVFNCADYIFMFLEGEKLIVVPFELKYTDAAGTLEHTYKKQLKGALVVSKHLISSAYFKNLGRVNRQHGFEFQYLPILIHHTKGKSSNRNAPEEENIFGLKIYKYYHDKISFGTIQNWNRTKCQVSFK